LITILAYFWIFPKRRDWKGIRIWKFSSWFLWLQN